MADVICSFLHTEGIRSSTWGAEDSYGIDVLVDEVDLERARELVTAIEEQERR